MRESMGAVYPARRRPGNGAKESVDLLLLDGPMGTELQARGLELPAPLWSAVALAQSPGLVRDIHREYARAGATVHTTNTFRTRRRSAGPQWEALARRAVELARDAVPAHHRVAGSMAPLEDCYHPERSPPEPDAEHEELADALRAAGVDLLLCETFPHVGEALAATRAAVATGLETWTSFTGGPDADLLSPRQVRDAAEKALELGARVVLVNCVSVRLVDPYVAALAELEAPFGVYANAGGTADGIGWRHDPTDGPDRYADAAERWAERGATVIGGCCGTGPAHIAALFERLA
jgi:S-methylmethionine-dependent homocysteine/selenocysteine methylase